MAGGTMEESRVRQVSSERRWSTRMGARGHEFRGVGKVYNLCRVSNLFEQPCPRYWTARPDLYRRSTIIMIMMEELVC
jgi:hypothetical protein